jgi:hypothetical protein
MLQSIQAKGEGLPLNTLPANHRCFGKELGYGLGRDGLLPDNKPILRLVVWTTVIVACAIAFGIVYIF